MYRAICLLIASLLLLCGCSTDNQTCKIDVASFSYANDCAYYKDAPGAKKSGFVNVEKYELNDAEKAVDMAKQECTVEYDTISVAFDSNSKVYRVSFYKDGCTGGDQNVYVDQNGIIQLIIYGE